MGCDTLVALGPATSGSCHPVRQEQPIWPRRKRWPGSSAA